MSQEETRQDEEEGVTISDVDQFANLVAQWHQSKIEQLKYLLLVPEGAVFEVGDDKIELSGNTLKGFKFGVEMALMQLKDLPFVAEVEDEAEPNDDPNRH